MNLAIILKGLAGKTVNIVDGNKTIEDLNDEQKAEIEQAIEDALEQVRNRLVGEL